MKNFWYFQHLTILSTSGILSTKIHVLGRKFLGCIMLLTCLISYFYLNYLITSHPYHHKSWIERKYLKLPSAFITLSITLYHCMNHLITGTVSKKSNEGTYFKNEREKIADLVLVIKFQCGFCETLKEQLWISVGKVYVQNLLIYLYCWYCV